MSDSYYTVQKRAMQIHFCRVAEKYHLCITLALRRALSEHMHSKEHFKLRNGTNGSITKSMEVIETIDVTNYPTGTKKRHSNVYNKDLCRDNKPLTDFINKCLLLDTTSGMEKVINKILLASYVKADGEYKESEKFRRVIKKAFQRLIDDPDRKYTHISDVAETLRIHVEVPDKLKRAPPPVKKRVNLITLSTEVSVNRKRPMIDSSTRSSPPKKSRPEVITLDCDDDDVIPIDDANEDNISNKIKENNEGKLQTEKENLVTVDTIEIQDSQEVKILEETQTAEHEQENTNKDENEKENLGVDENLLVPHKEKIVRLEKPKLKKKVPAKKPEQMTEAEKARRIQKIEAKIDKCKKTIAKLDLEEVKDDSANSPYFKCDRLRATIVTLYKELCTLVDEEPPKRRKIELKIKEGVPEGPIKRLEKFLNKQADEGETPFPDFSDVVQCVETANEKDGLGWSKPQVMKEAQAIFTYCGRALQKKRQQREWKHLRALAVPEEFEADPAEGDPELQARLEANRLLATQREAEVFNKFTHMEDNPEPSAYTSFVIENPSEDEYSSDEENESPPTALKESDNDDKGNDEVTCNSIETAGVKLEPQEIQYQGDVSLVINISDSESEDDQYGVLTF